MDELGRRIARYRQEAGLTQKQLAALVGRSESWLSQVERGTRAIDRLSVREVLAAALEVPLDELFPPPQGRFNRRELLSAMREVPPVTIRGVVSASIGDVLMLRLNTPVERMLPKGLPVTVTLHADKGGSNDDRR